MPVAVTKVALHTRVPLICLALVALLGLTSCSSSGTSSVRDSLLWLGVPRHQTIGTVHVAGLGDVLADAHGRALYMFPPDAGMRVTCTGACAGTWPPVVIADRKRPSAGRGVRSRLLSTLVDPNSGARVVTYAGHPLYRYAGDVQRDTANGQAIVNDGGPWYVLSPTGNPITSATAGRK